MAHELLGYQTFVESCFRAFKVFAPFLRNWSYKVKFLKKLIKKKQNNFFSYVGLLIMEFNANLETYN